MIWRHCEQTNFTEEGLAVTPNKIKNHPHAPYSFVADTWTEVAISSRVKPQAQCGKDEEGFVMLFVSSFTSTGGSVKIASQRGFGSGFG